MRIPLPIVAPWLLVLACAGLAPARAAAGLPPAATPVLGAMQAELARSLTALKSEPTPPYFLSYEITETRRVPLIERGRFTGFLMARIPIDGFPVSNGHGRKAVGAAVVSRQSILIVESAKAIAHTALKQELLKLVEQRGKDYGVIIRRLGNPQLRSASAGGRGASRAEPAILAVKVFPDGREEPLRNLEVAGIDAPAFKDILVAGREPFINTVPFRGVICSFAVPSLLFEDLTLKKPAGKIGRPPIAPHPFFDR